jgi:Ran GTPase-activating protein (RanGAP) involved in mRNA processing and transport
MNCCLSRYGCELGDTGMETIAGGIQDCFSIGGSLKVVDFTNNCLSDAGVAVLASALPTSMVELYLDYNQCGDQGLFVLMSKAVVWTELKILRLVRCLLDSQETIR